MYKTRLVHTEKREFSPQITSFNFRVGAHPATYQAMSYHSTV